MAVKTTFKRIEEKFLLNEFQYSVIKKEIDTKFHSDEYGKTKICNIYFDTPEFVLIRNSISKPVFKEKLRLRTYGVPDSINYDSFIEIKRKYKSVVYKRRLFYPLSVSDSILSNKPAVNLSSQIEKEFEYFLNYYKNISPKIYLSYDRSAFFSNDIEDFRITFDKNITYRDYDLDLLKGSYGEKLIDDNSVLMEAKTSGTFPIWLARILSELKVTNTSFSKVGKSYLALLSQRRIKNNDKIVSKSVYTGG